MTPEFMKKIRKTNGAAAPGVSLFVLPEEIQPLKNSFSQKMGGGIFQWNESNYIKLKIIKITLQPIFLCFLLYFDTLGKLFSRETAF